MASDADIGAAARLAVLIDAENATYRLVSEILAEVGRYGVATVKRAYGDWTSGSLSGWREALPRHAIRPVQQFALRSGKNSADIALVIDAMDILHARQVDGLCIVSSDGDFTGLVQRMRESGLLVLGFGERSKAHEGFVAACDRFVYFENIDPQHARERAAAPSPHQDQHLIGLLREAIRLASDEEGWAHLSAVRANLVRLQPAFDHRTWGATKFSDLARLTQQFEFEERGRQGAGTSLHIRDPRGGRA